MIQTTKTKTKTKTENQKKKKQIREIKWLNTHQVKHPPTSIISRRSKPHHISNPKKHIQINEHTKTSQKNSKKKKTPFEKK